MRKGILFGVLFLVMWAGAAGAGMSEFISYTAKGAGISVDAKGLATNTVGTIRAEIPTGASVYKAFLYSAAVWGGVLSNVEFDGNTLISGAASRLDQAGKQATAASENRWDVTSIVNAKVLGGSGVFNFGLKELGYLDGEILAVLYYDSTKPLSTAMIYDGELATAGDAFNISLGTAVDKTNPNFFATMSLGISWGYQSGSPQYSRVDVNGVRLTTSAGGEDDGIGEEGRLITAGGIGDSTANPANPLLLGGTDPRADDELYSLNSFLTDGDTSISISTSNPSNNDNVFFLAFSTLAEAKGAPTGVPEPATLLLLGFGLAGMARLRRGFSN